MTRKPAPHTEAATLIKQFFQVYDEMSSSVADILEELDLSQSQAGLLWALEPSKPPMPMRELARKLHFDPSNITLMTDRLVSVGLVERRPHPTDGRQRVLALTDKGVKVLDVLITRLELQSPVFTMLTEPERAQLGRLLTKAQTKSPLLS